MDEHEVQASEDVGHEEFAQAVVRRGRRKGAATQAEDDAKVEVITREAQASGDRHLMEAQWALLRRHFPVIVIEIVVVVSRPLKEWVRSGSLEASEVAGHKALLG